MTQGFYEQLGADPRSSTEEVRVAYTRVVAQLMKRRKALAERGGDTAALDLARAQADEAWAVLADPVRRRRYDALRALSQDGFTTNADELYKRVSGALVPPAAAAAAELLRVATTIPVGALAPSPGIDTSKPPVAPRATPEPDAEATVTGATMPRRPRPVASAAAEASAAPAKLATPPAVVARAPAVGPKPALKVVDGTPSAPSVLLMRSEPASDAPTVPPVQRVKSPPRPAEKELPPELLARLIDENGYSGALLRAVREAKGTSLQDMADTTRISARYLEAIEEDEHDRLPSATFVRGYVREMARLLGLDEERVTTGYMRRFQS